MSWQHATARELTSNNNPLRQCDGLHKLRPRILQRRPSPVLALHAELVFWRELRHVWWPLTLRWVRAVVVWIGREGELGFVGGDGGRGVLNGGVGEGARTSGGEETGGAQGVWGFLIMASKLLSSREGWGSQRLPYSEVPWLGDLGLEGCGRDWTGEARRRGGRK